jgi:glycosyltransferase involved in cell wall biosynthesis
MAHAAAISRLHAQAGRAAPDADPVASVPSRIRMLGRRFLARRPRLVAKLQRFSVQHPRLHRLLWTPARLAWRTISLQWPRRRAVRAKRHLPSAAPLMRWARGAWQARRTENSPFRVRRLGSAAAPSMPARADRRIVCVTHVLPYPARAGNEYRIARMLGWLARNGWQVLLVVSPLEDGPHIEERAARAAEMFSDLIVCRRDGTLLHHLTGDGMMLDRLDGGHPRKYAGLLREHAGDQRARHVHKLVRNFCPDRLVELLLHIEKHFDPQVILAEYVFMARPFPLLRTRVRKVIDTIDVFSNKGRKVEAFGIADGARLEPEEESRLLARADLLIAIQPVEAADLRALAPDRPVICVGVDFEVADRKPAAATAPVVLLVASDNKLNVKGLRDFLRFAWPLVRREVPDAELRVVGSVGEHIDAWSPGVRVLGRVDDLDAAYADARLVINPAVAGTGLKIKTVEAVSHARPIVLWPTGVEGLAPQARAMCHTATDWFEFAQHVIRLLQEDAAAIGGDRGRELAEQFTPDRVYAPLAQALG